MDEIQFIFQATEMDEEALVPQLQKAIELRMQRRQEEVPKLFRKAAQKNSTPEKCEAAAREFLKGHGENLKEHGDVQVCFSDEEMIVVMGDLEDLEQDAVTFDEIDLVFEGPDMFFVVYRRNRGMLLQKKDMDQEVGTVEEFQVFLKHKGCTVIEVE